MSTLEEWTDEVRAEFGLSAGDVDRDAILDVARVVAHNVARPAAPLTAYLLGLAVGRGHNLADAAATVSRLAERRSPDAG